GARFRDEKAILAYATQEPAVPRGRVQSVQSSEYRQHDHADFFGIHRRKKRLDRQDQRYCDDLTADQIYFEARVLAKGNLATKGHKARKRDVACFRAFLWLVFCNGSLLMQTLKLWISVFVFSALAFAQITPGTI